MAWYELQLVSPNPVLDTGQAHWPAYSRASWDSAGHIREKTNLTDWYIFLV